MKDCANNEVRYFMKQINDIRDTFKQDQTDITNLFQEVNTQLNVLKEADRFITKEVNLCEYRLNNCEKEIGYHLLGKKEHKDNILKENSVIAIEPGVYLPGRFGIRIEDTFKVTKNGCINLTKSGKDYTIIKLV
jgi:hypothetical protein